MNGKNWLRIRLNSLFGMFGFSVLMPYGMHLVSCVVGAIIIGTVPAVTAVASMLLLGDKASWQRIAAIGLAVVGVIILRLLRLRAPAWFSERTVWRRPTRYLASKFWLRSVR
jgi:drug/metabolite transporter (DMT)-like permease